MMTIAVIAEIIGTTELLFELLDRHERKRHDCPQEKPISMTN